MNKMAVCLLILRSDTIAFTHSSLPTMGTKKGKHATSPASILSCVSAAAYVSKFGEGGSLLSAAALDGVQLITGSKGLSPGLLRNQSWP
jgi:hypothetical protein